MVFIKKYFIMRPPNIIREKFLCLDNRLLVRSSSNVHWDVIRLKASNFGNSSGYSPHRAQKSKSEQSDNYWSASKQVESGDWDTLMEDKGISDLGI